MDSENYGLNMNVSFVYTDKGIDAGVNIEDSSGLKVNKNYKELDKGKAMRVIADDVARAASKHFAKLAEQEKAEKEEKQAKEKDNEPIDVETRLKNLADKMDELRHDNERLRKENKELRAADKRRPCVDKTFELRFPGFPFDDIFFS